MVLEASDGIGGRVPDGGVAGLLATVMQEASSAGSPRRPVCMDPTLPTDFRIAPSSLSWTVRDPGRPH